MRSIREQLSDEVATGLQAHGWTPERGVSSESARQALASDGVLLHSVAAQVLESLGGLTLRSGSERWARHLRFDAAEACQWIAEEDWPFIRALFSPSACPVASGESTLYFVSAEGRWMALHDGWTVCYFLPDLDSVLRFAVLFGKVGAFQGRRIERHEIPPGYWDL